MANNYELQPNQTIFVTGVVEYSAIGSVIKGKRLDQLNQNRHSKYPAKEHTSITINDAKIWPVGHKELTESEKYIQAKRFFNRNSDADKSIKHFEAENRVYRRMVNGREETLDEALKHYLLPWVAVKTPDSKHVKQYKLKKGEELEQGQKVVLALHTFQGGQGRPGLVLNGVIVSSANPDRPDIRSFGSQSSMMNDLSKLGLILDNPDEAEENDQPVRKLKDSELPGAISTPDDKDAPAENATESNATGSDESNAHPEDKEPDESKSETEVNPWFKNEDFE